METVKKGSWPNGRKGFWFAETPNSSAIRWFSELRSVLFNSQLSAVYFFSYWDFTELSRVRVLSLTKSVTHFYSLKGEVTRFKGG